MPIYVSLLLALIVLIAIVSAACWLHHRHHTKQRAERIAERTVAAKELLANYQTGPEARQKLAQNWRTQPWPEGMDQELMKQLKAANHQILLDDNRAKYLPGLNNAYEQFVAEPEAAKKAEVLLQILRLLEQCWDEVRGEFEATSGLNQAAAKAQIQQLIHQRVEELAAILAGQRNPGAFRELNMLRHDCKDEYRAYERKFAPYAPTSSWPLPNWNDLVAHYVANPHLYDFTGMRDMPAGEVRRLAAEALRDQNLTEAKIVLAWCNFSSKIRVEVGDVLSADLAKFIAAEAKHWSEQPD